LYIAGVLFRSGDYFRSFLWAARAWRTGLLFRVLPYVIAVFVQRLLHHGPSARQVMLSGVSLETAAIPGPLIPYDRIYDAQSRSVAAGSRYGGALGSRIPQSIGLVLAFLFISWLHHGNDGLWYQGDAPRHAANGLFWYDLITAGSTNFTHFAARYYARYPVINP